MFANILEYEILKKIGQIFGSVTKGKSTVFLNLSTWYEEYKQNQN